MKNGAIPDVVFSQESAMSVAVSYVSFTLPPSRLSNLFVYYREGQLQAVKYLVEELHWDPSERFPQPPANPTPLMLSCIRGHLDIVQYLLSANANRSDRDDSGRTALLYAAAANHNGNSVAILKCLFEHGAKVDFRSTIIFLLLT